MRRNAVLFVACLVVAAMIVVPGTASAQCAMCRRALESPEGQQLIGAFRRGILVLLAAPFLLFGVIAFFAIRAQRKAETDRPSEIA
jgi:hypothetical protein